MNNAIGSDILRFLRLRESIDALVANIFDQLLHFRSIISHRPNVTMSFHRDIIKAESFYTMTSTAVELDFRQYLDNLFLECPFDNDSPGYTGVSGII